MTLRAGLTGGIGSGKSTVATFFQKYGVPVVDTDQISKDLTNGHTGRALPLIRSVFGNAVFETNGLLARDRLRDLIFHSKPHKTQLEAILHPLIRQEAERKFDNYVQQHFEIVVFDIPLLVESQSWQESLDKILVVLCEENTQIQRVAARSNWPNHLIETVIKQQATRKQRLAVATDVIHNENLSLEELQEEVKFILHQWRKYLEH